LLGAAGLWTLATWVFSIAMALLVFLSSIKAMTERLTYAWLRRGKARRAAKLAAAQEGLAAAQNGVLVLAPSPG
jgi:hypothetical protein